MSFGTRRLFLLLGVLMPDVSDAAATAAGVDLDWSSLIDQALSSDDAEVGDGATDDGDAADLDLDLDTSALESPEDLAPEDAESPEADDDEDGAPTGELTADVATTLFGYIDQVFADEASLAQVPEAVRSFVGGAAAAIKNHAQQTAQQAFAQGISQGERFAVLNELFIEDREAFEAEIAKDPAEGQRFYGWKAELAKKAGTEVAPEQQAVIDDAREVLEELSEYPDRLAAVQAEAKRLGLQANPRDLRRLTRLVDRALLEIESGAAAPARQPASRATERVANQQRLKQLPKADVGTGGARSGARGLLESFDVRKPGAGRDLVARALAGEFQD